MAREPLGSAPSKPASATSASWLRRVAWFVGLWLASVGVLTAVALLIRVWIKP